jgi:hypothetical protein
MVTTYQTTGRLNPGDHSPYGFEVLTAVGMNMVGFWVVAPWYKFIAVSEALAATTQKRAIFTAMKTPNLPG